MRARSVWLIPDPGKPEREPLVEVYLDDADAVIMVPLKNHLMSFIYGDDIRLMAAQSMKQLASLSAVDLTANRLPASCGPQLVLGDLVRVFYEDGTSEDLDESTLVADVRNQPNAKTARKLLRREPVNGTGECAQFYDADTARTARTVTATLLPARAARGCLVLVEPIVGGRERGREWDRGVVESWEHEARRLRQRIATTRSDLKAMEKRNRKVMSESEIAEEREGARGFCLAASDVGFELARITLQKDRGR